MYSKLILLVFEIKPNSKIVALLVPTMLTAVSKSLSPNQSEGSKLCIPEKTPDDF